MLTLHNQKGFDADYMSGSGSIKKFSIRLLKIEPAKVGYLTAPRVIGRRHKQLKIAKCINYDHLFCSTEMFFR